MSKDYSDATRIVLKEHGTELLSLDEQIALLDKVSILQQRAQVNDESTATYSIAVANTIKAMKPRRRKVDSAEVRRAYLDFKKVYGTVHGAKTSLAIQFGVSISTITRALVN